MGGRIGKRKRRSRRRRAAAGAGLGAFAALGAAGPAQADDTFTVTKLADTSDGTCDADCSLREAIIVSNGDMDSDTILFQAGLSGTISLTDPGNELNVTRPVTINGPGADVLAVSGLDEQQVFYVNQVVPGEAVVISGLTLTRGEADNSGGPDTGRGGAVRSVDADLTISGCALTDNNTYLPYGVGGAVYQGDDGSVTIANSTLTRNKAGYGSALESVTTTLVRNSTVTDNAFTAIGHSSNTNLWVMDSTVTRNGIGLDYSLAFSARVINSIVADNSLADLDANFDAAFSLIENPGTTTVTDEVLGSNLIGADPALGPLQANGGPTLTQRPAFNSPVVDRGNTAEIADQRGFPRPLDVPYVGSPALPGADAGDIGAVELSVAEATPPPAPPVVTPVPVTRKKCKKGKKLKKVKGKRKCVKRKKKKK